MRVTLVHPPDDPDAKRRPRKSHLLGILYVAAAAREAGHTVRVVDAQARQGKTQACADAAGSLQRWREDLCRKICDDTDVIGISIPFSHLARVGHDLVAQLRAHAPGVPLILGGAYPSSQPAMAATSGADYLVIGEGEVPFVNLLDHLSRGSVPPPLPGIVPCARDGSPSPKPYRTACINALPGPARDLVPYQEYTQHSQRNIMDTRTASIVTSRGCPYDCEFCSIHSVFGYKWRARCAESVLEEIDCLTDRYDVHNVEIEDDNFTLEPDRASVILEGLIRRNENGAQLTWTAPNGLRIDTLDAAMIGLIAQSRCRYAFLAIEHGDEHVLNDVIGKRLDLTRVAQVAHMLHRKGVQCYSFVLYGYPGADEEAFGRALRYYHHLKHLCPGMEYAFLLPEPYPGTRLWTRATENGWLPRSAFGSPTAMSAFYYARGPWIETPDMPRGEVQRRGRILRSEFPSEQTYVEGLDILPPQTDAVGDREAQ